MLLTWVDPDLTFKICPIQKTDKGSCPVEIIYQLFTKENPVKNLKKLLTLKGWQKGKKISSHNSAFII
jgi:hypothetical protein